MIGNAAAPVNLRVSLAGVVLNVCPEINTKLQLLSLLLGVLDFDGTQEFIKANQQAISAMEAW